MSTGRDDDALHWGGDDDPTLDTGAAAPAPAEPTVLPDGFRAVGRGADESGQVARPAGESPAPVHAEPLGNAALIGLGVLGGVYLLFVIGWVLGGLRLQGRAQYLVTDVMYQGSFWLAVLAPVLWFVTVFVLTRGARTWLRVLWLVAGVVLLVPWPFVMVGAIGQ